MITLPKSTRQARMIENASVENIELSSQDMETLDSLDERLVTDWWVNETLHEIYNANLSIQGPNRGRLMSVNVSLVAENKDLWFQIKVYIRDQHFQAGSILEEQERAAVNGLIKDQQEGNNSW